MSRIFIGWICVGWEEEVVYTENLRLIFKINDHEIEVYLNAIDHGKFGYKGLKLG